MAARIRQVKRDIDFLYPNVDIFFARRKDVSAALSRYAEFLEGLLKGGRPIDVHFVIAVFISIAGAKVLYKTVGKRRPDWDAIGEAVVHAFNDVLPNDDGSRNPGEWARKTFTRFSKKFGNKEFSMKAMKDSIVRILLDKRLNESIIVPREYFEKIHGRALPK